MRQTSVAALAKRGPHAAVIVPVDIALQGGGLLSLQHAFGRLEGGVDASDHLESLDRVEIDPSTMIELQVPSA